MGGYQRELVEIRERVAAKKALHLQQIEEVKQEMRNIKPVIPTQRKQDRQPPIMSPAGFAMDIRLRKEFKPILKNVKD